jgi:cell shape-determining protein MreC
MESMSNLRNTIEHIAQLKKERENILKEIDELKDLAIAKEKALQSEVSMFREELKSLRELLGVEEPAFEQEQTQKEPPRKTFSTKR